MSANEWGNGWYLIAESIIDTVNYEMQNKYEKLKKLKNSQKAEDRIITPSKFYSRVVKNTNINFSKDELAVLSKGLKYNLHFEQKSGFQHLLLKLRQPLTNCPH
jgi:hypothetical protein